MIPHLTGMMLVRNEADRYLGKSLDHMGAICDRVVVLDDASTDRTAEFCRHFGADVHVNDQRMFADEWRARAKLWDLVVATDPQWVLALDADEVFEEDMRVCCSGLLRCAEDMRADAIGFTLYDLWDHKDTYRDDALWTGHKRSWEVMMRYRPGVDYHWREQAHHCGRLPLAPSAPEPRVMHSSLRLLHYGWMRPEDRERKHRRYLELDPDGRFGSMAQYRSILDDHPRLSRLEEGA